MDEYMSGRIYNYFVQGGRKILTRSSGGPRERQTHRTMCQAKTKSLQSINTSTVDYSQESTAIAEKLSWSLGYIDRARAKSANTC